MHCSLYDITLIALTLAEILSAPHTHRESPRLRVKYDHARKNGARMRVPETLSRRDAYTNIFV